MKLTKNLKYNLKVNKIDAIVRKYNYNEYIQTEYGVINKDDKVKKQYSDILNMTICDDNKTYDGLQIINMAKQFNINEYKRLKRIKTRLEYMLTQGNCLFLTLTFNQSHYLSTTQETRRMYAYRFLKSQDCMFICNQDFGKTNGRHHLHAIVRLDNIDFNSWTFGNMDVERVRISSKQPIGYYLGKITEHTIKESTKNTRVMYSRNQWNIENTI